MPATVLQDFRAMFQLGDMFKRSFDNEILIIAVYIDENHIQAFYSSGRVSTINVIEISLYLSKKIWEKVNVQN